MRMKSKIFIYGAESIDENFEKYEICVNDYSTDSSLDKIRETQLVSPDQQ